MVKFRNPTGRFLTGAVAAAALTAFAAGAAAQMSPDTRRGMTDREMMMQQERMGGMGQQMTDRERALRQQRMQPPGTAQTGSAQTSAMPGGAGAADSVQGRLQMWDMDRYVGLQQAVAAHQYCRSELSEPAMRAVISRIEARAGEPPSPGRKLAIQDDAQFHMKEIIRVEGCADPRVKSALSAFDELLAPAANEAVAAMPR
ncbi:hypothetical protein ACM64Y_11070 [Novispirillum sp. DQ9]|uniref:hypothetical protein n=1 Tax=Novispirillum sp. DQ9 TaxID=3398612 RepID=UPI003C7A8456